MLVARLRCPFPWPIPLDINVIQTHVLLLGMVPISASLSHIFVPYPGPVALSRTPVLNPDPKKVSRAGEWSPYGSSTVSEFSFIRQANPLNGGALFMKHASWWIYLQRVLAFGFWKSWERWLHWSTAKKDPTLEYVFLPILIPLIPNLVTV